MESLPTNHWHTTIDSSGRVLLPAELRQLANLEPGMSVVWVKDESGLHLKSLAQLLAEIQEYYRSLGPADELWSDALIEQRRIEAAHE